MDVVFVDRDGTINVEKNYLYRIEEFELIPGVLQALKLLTDNNILVYIITNQSGIARGYYTEEDFHRLTQHMLRVFSEHGIKIKDVLYCPHHPEGIVPQYTKKCLCRKPGTKLVEDVIAQNNLDVTRAAFIGDSQTDVATGARLGMTTYLVETGYGKTAKNIVTPSYIKKDLLASAQHIVFV